MQTFSPTRSAPARPAEPPAPPAFPSLPPAVPDHRKLREKVIFSLIGTNSTGGPVGRAPALIADAEQIIDFILTGKQPAPASAA